MQCAVVEFARDVLGLEDANSTEFDQTTEHPVIWLMDEQQSVRQRGGTMRLGSWPCALAPAADGPRGVRRRPDRRAAPPPLRVQQRLPARLRGERPGRHRAPAPTATIVEIVELTDHPWFVAVQFHPEFKSKPTRGPPAVPRVRRRRPAAARARPDRPPAPSSRHGPWRRKGEGAGGILDRADDDHRAALPSMGAGSSWRSGDGRIASHRGGRWSRRRSIPMTTGSRRPSGTSRSTAGGDTRSPAPT